MFVYCLQVYAAIYEYKRSSLAVANISKKMSEHLPCNCLNVRMFPRQKHRLLGRLDVCLREKGGAEHPQCDSCDPGPIVQQNKQREAGEEDGEKRDWLVQVESTDSTQTDSEGVLLTVFDFEEPFSFQLDIETYR